MSISVALVQREKYTRKYCSKQYAIANDASMKIALYQTKYLISRTLSNFRNWTIISDFSNSTIMSDFRNYSTTICDFRNLKTIFDFSNSNHLQNIQSISPTKIYVHFLSMDHQYLLRYVSISWAWTPSIILQCPLNIWLLTSDKQTYSRQQQVSKMSIKIDIVTRMSYVFLLSPSRNLILIFLFP